MTEPPVLLDGLRLYPTYSVTPTGERESVVIKTLDGKRSAGRWMHVISGDYAGFRAGLVEHRRDRGDEALHDATLDDVVRAAGVEFGSLTIIPCGGKKLDHRAKARELYTGALFRSALAAAQALRNPIRILSALHGLIPLDQALDPYDVTIGDEVAVRASFVRAQLGVTADHPERITALLPRRYDDLLTAAVGQPVANPLRGSRGIGEQRGRLAALARGSL